MSDATQVEEQVELSDRRRRAVEAANADYYAMADKVDRLTADLAAVKLDRAQLDLTLGSKLEEIDRLKREHERVIEDMRRHHDENLASARAEVERSRTEVIEANTQRAAHETLFRNIAVQVQDFAPPSEPLPRRRQPFDGRRIIEGVEREIASLAAPTRNGGGNS